MSKKLLLIGSFLLVTSIAGVGSYLLLKPEVKPSNLIPSPILDKIQKEELGESTVFEDEAGFSFKHPKAITIIDETPSDPNTEYYSFLNGVKGTGFIKVEVMDTQYKAIEDYVKNEKKGLSLVGAITLGGISASQYATEDPPALYTIAVDKATLYIIATPKDGGYWDEVHDLVVSSFAFEGTQKAQNNANAGGGEAIYEEEEIVE